MTKYYILVEEWLYPTESGRDVVEDTFDTRDEALEFAMEQCRKEMSNYFENTKCDPFPPSAFKTSKGEGVIVTDRNGLEEWYYSVRIVEMDPLQ